MAVSLPSPRRQETCPHPVLPAPTTDQHTREGTRLPGQTHPCFQVVQATLLTLPSPLCPSPARPHSRGEALSSPAEGFSCLLGSSRKGSPQRQVRERRHNGPWTGWRRPAGPPRAGKGCSPQAGQTSPWVPTCPGPAPPFSGGAVLKAPGPGKSQADEPPPRVAAGREPLASARRTQLVGPAAGSPTGLPRLPPPAPGMKAT